MQQFYKNNNKSVNYEARDKQDNAPIVDLLSITKLQDWTSAASEYINHGYAIKLKENIMDTLKPLLRNSDTRTDTIHHIMVEWITAKGIAFPEAVQQPLREVVHRISPSSCVQYQS